eukprot:4548925-Amphidinium_carterae.1
MFWGVSGGPNIRLSGRFLGNNDAVRRMREARYLTPTLPEGLRPHKGQQLLLQLELPEQGPKITRTKLRGKTSDYP